MTLPTRLLVLSAGSLIISLTTVAQEDLLLQDTIVVEGARGNPMLADIEPEVALDFAEIRAYGAASLEELLADLEPLTQSARGGAPAILLNGRRVAGFRQIRNYPPEALASVEILPEEVALKFGFRANQKVINFVLRDRFHALSTRSRVGAPTDGGQWLSEIDVSNLRIRDDARWNFDAEYEFQDGLRESDRDIVSEVDGTDADRSLLAEEHALDLTASLSHFLPGEISATYAGGLDLIQRNRDIAQSDLSDTLDRQTDEVGAEASFVLNKVYTGWNWSVNGGLNYRDVQTDTALDPVSGFQESTNSETQTANLEGVLFRELIELPAGKIVSTVKLGIDHSDLDSQSNQNGVITQSSLSRTQSNAQTNIDIPILDSDMNSNPLGTLNLNANNRVDDVSDFGTLSSYGIGLTWKPIESLQILASTARNETAPALALLGDPISVTETARVFDFATGETVENVTRISGGNPDLASEEQTVHRFNINWDPFETPDITFNLTYTDTKTDNAILSFPGLTPQIEAAFPGRVIRDDSGALLSLDARAINVEESQSRQIRYGFNWSHRLPRPERPDLSDEERRQLRQIFLRRLDEEDRVRVQQRIAEREARQASGQNAGPRAGQQGRGRGRGFGGRGGRGGGRIFASVYHTYVLEDSLRIGADTETLDLLDGDAISDLGGTPQHLLEAQAGFSNGPIGAFIRANWQSETEFEDGANGALKFDDLATVNMRVQYNFGSNPRLLLKYPILDSTRVSIGVDNLFNEKQRVTDVQGLVPITYQPDLLDPQGRVVTLRFRKLFF
ncbi:MAG: hypothetical protein AAFV59_05005 [Pseudomonadota bacterium]